jgi:hypothetical protein
MSSNVATFSVDLVPAISTCHVSEETAKRLDEGKDCPWTIVAAYEHGWFIWCQASDLMDTLDVPEDLRAVMEWGNRHNVKWVRMDCDQGAVADLPHYDW